jgi:hypothetical protein
VYREGFKPNSGRLRFQGYLLDSAIGEGIQILDVSSIMLDSEEKLLLEHRELQVKVNIFENFAFEEIVVLNKRIEVLLKD